MAWLGVGALALTYASTLLYTDVDEDQALARVLAFALACEGMTLTLQTLKRRLVDAERRAATVPVQRETVDTALHRAIVAVGDPRHVRRVQDPARVALLVIVCPDGGELAELAERARAVVRTGDVVTSRGAGIAIIAMGTGHDGARRMAQALHVAAAQLEGRPAIRIGWGVYPDDAPSAAALHELVEDALHDAPR
jgi:hypothetical protein